MRLRAIIIDDEEIGIETLKLLIGEHVKDVKVIAQTTRASEAIEMIEDYVPDIVFLDISMPEMDGFEMLEKLKWKNFHLIFTTAHQEYGLKALKNNAADYLLKPIDYNDLCAAIEKIKTKIIDQKIDYSHLTPSPDQLSKTIFVTTKNGLEKINVSEIDYLESKSNYTQIYLDSNISHLTPKTLKEFESQLCNESFRFIRIHNSFIINSRKISRYLKDTEEIILLNNQKIPLSKGRKEEFFNWLNI